MIPDTLGLHSSAARRQLSPYPAYQPTGVEWIPSIPQGWRIKRLRYALLMPTKAEIRSLPADRVASFVPMEAVGEFGGLALEQTRPIEDVLTGYTYFRDGDVLVAKITPCFENGKGAIAEGLEGGIGFGTTELHVLRGVAFDARFLFYLTLGEDFRRLGAAEMYGAGGQKRVPERFIRELRHPIPPIEEQRAIAAFLDRETARIDALVAKKQRLIDLLQEKRSALISTVLAKGLESTVATQDSQLAWLGRLPASWDILPLRRVLRAIEQGWSPQADQRSADDDEWAVLKVGAVYKGTFRPSEQKALPAGAEPERHFEVAEGDLLLTRGNTPELVADVCVVPATRRYLMMSDLHYRLSVASERLSQHFLCYWLLSRLGRFQIERDARGTSGSMVKVTQAHIRSWITPVPSLSEQQRIVEYLDSTTESTRVALEKVSEAIGRLREYRSALISAAVTGKIDVRNRLEDAPCP